MNPCTGRLAFFYMRQTYAALLCHHCLAFLLRLLHLVRRFSDLIEISTGGGKFKQHKEATRDHLSCNIFGRQTPLCNMHCKSNAITRTLLR